MKLFMMFFVLMLFYSNSCESKERAHQRLKVNVSVIQDSFENDLREKGHFLIKYKIINNSRHRQVIDLWTGCTAFNWVTDRNEIIVGVQVCDKNYCSGQLGEYGPGQFVSKKLPIRFNEKTMPGLFTFRLGYYTCYQDPKIENNVAWSHPVTIEIKPWMLKTIQRD